MNMSDTFDPSTPKKAGDLVLSQDWNNAMDEIVRLEDAKVDRNNPEHMTGSLIVDGNVAIGTTNLIDKLHVVGDRIRLQSTGEVEREIVLRVGGDAVALQTDTSNLLICSMNGEAIDHHVLINPTENEGYVGIGTGSPEEKLHVNGNILMDGSEKLYALGGLANYKIVAGYVEADGTFNPDEGFEVHPGSTGRYQVDFKPRFNSEPVVLATSATSSDSDHVITVFSITAEGFNVKIRDISTNSFQNTRFTFIALGVR
jgi:hypothetical protein